MRLLIRPGAIGDFILSLPALESLAEGDAEVWAPSAVLPLARFARSTRSIASTGLDLLELGEPDGSLVSTLRSFDRIVSWYGANRPEFRQRVRELGLPVEFLAALPPADSRLHACDFYLEQARQLGGSPADGVPRIPVTVDRGAYAVIHPFSGGRAKCWPLERFQTVSRELERSLPVFWCAGPEEVLPEAVRIPDLYDLASWLAGARVYLGNDSGITHLAAASETPVVALFGPTDPAVWGPRGARVRIVATRQPGEPIEALTEAAVLHAIRQVLSSYDC